MSTIHDALKKVQNDLSEKKEEAPANMSETPPTEAPPPTPPSAPIMTPKEIPDPDKDSPEESKGIKIILILLSVIICAALAATIFLILKKGLHLSDVLPAKTQKVVVQNPEPVQSHSTVPVLNGIMLIEGKAVALINNKIYSVGDSVNGSRILAIDKDRAILNTADGKPYTLKISP